jgi:hypothetical protein
MVCCMIGQAKRGREFTIRDLLAVCPYRSLLFRTGCVPDLATPSRLVACSHTTRYNSGPCLTMICEKRAKD